MLERASVCFTFDDWYVPQWYTLKDLFKAFDARVSFYIARPHWLDSDSMAMLGELEQDGHEIGFHTTNHLALPRYVAHHGLDRYLSHEIDAGLDILRKNGFSPTTFSYPYNRFTEAANARLLERFRLIRLGEGPKGWRRNRYGSRDNRVVYTIGSLDRTSRELDDKYYDIRFRNLQRNRLAGVLVGHKIADSNTHRRKVPFCSADDMERILTSARNAGLDIRPLRELAP